MPSNSHARNVNRGLTPFPQICLKMDQRPKCEIQNYQLLEDNTEEILKTSGKYWLFRYDIKGMMCTGKK